MDYMDFLIKLATILSGLATVLIAYLTYHLYQENRRLRKAGSSPLLVAYFESHRDGTGGVNITICNVGTGPAKDVYFQILDINNKFSEYKLILDCSKKRGPISFIPQGEKVSTLFAIGSGLFKTVDDESLTFPPFHVQVEWSSIDYNKSSKTYTLDINPFADLSGFSNKPYLLKIVNSLDKIGLRLDGLNADVEKLANVIEVNSLASEVTEKHKGNIDR